MIMMKKLLKAFVCVLCGVLVVPLLLTVALSGNETDSAVHTEDLTLTDDFHAFVSEAVADAKEGALSVRKRYWINADAAELPPRDDSKYGTAKDASELQWLLDEAAPLLEGQETLFSTDIEIREGTEITYYLDESIFAICWQQVLDRIVYTIAEVKIGDPSQFRRYLADGYYGSPRLYPTTKLAEQAGAVIACSGDHFRGRNHGIVVYEGEVKRFTGETFVDSCFVDSDGDLNITQRGTFPDQQALEQYIAEQDIRFSFSFGPALIIDGVRTVPSRYSLGEINDGYPRCAIAQKDTLHYLMVTTNGNGRNYNYPTIAMFTDQIEAFGVQQAYTLDGGQTGAIAMQDKLMNPNEYQTGQRTIGDMFFFATAVPEEKS